ncbi:MAG: DUF2892 domain-containing protein [Gemmatimonadaceae bacterium]
MNDSSRAFAAFMASSAGRLIRIAAGVALIAWGWSMRDQTSGIVLMVGGLAPLLAGAFNVCLLAPLIGAPFAGKDARSPR